MAYGIPLEIYQMLEKVLGKEDAQKAVEILQKSINESLESSEEKLKISISEELKKELASKYDVELLRQEMKTLEVEFKKEIDVVRREIDIVRKEIEITRVEFKKDLRIAVIILIAIIVILNQNSLELLAKLIGIVK
ncbi:hypothetical protein [Sulfurihydrogenibium sp.]|jgi:hypothetical protein|uniref:hypothetical protein n=2 Tax=Sulfurihydrogenibium sp. TaxID=2053621 RepID=UPI00260E3FA4|nr:hypothetical protein [Sulfurihydrogenibium sp.]